MDLEKTTQRLSKDLELFGLDHRCSKLQLYRSYQRYLKKWKLDNFENMEQKLSASKKIDKAHTEGLTTPISTICLFSYLFFTQKLYNDYGDPRIALMLTSILCMLMISSIPFPKFHIINFLLGFIRTHPTR